MKKYLILFIFTLLLLPSLSFSEDIYVAQTEQGGGAGTSCAEAESAAWFNTAGNWGGGAGEIDPGDTVYLCDDGGNFTVTLLPPSSGSSGSPVTIKNAPGESPVIDGGDSRSRLIDIQDKDYLTFDGIQMQNAASGSASVYLTSGSTGITIKNCTIYHPRGRGFASTGAVNVTIQNNTFDTTVIDNEYEADNLYMQNGGGGDGHIIEGNEFYEHQSGSYIDGIQTYDEDGPMYIRNNYFYSDTAASSGDSMQIQLENGSGDFYVIGNVVYNSVEPTNTVVFNSTDADYHIYNNTIVNKAWTAVRLTRTPNSLVAKNNIFHSTDNVCIRSIQAVTNCTFENNLYYHPGSAYVADVIYTDRAWAYWTGTYGFDSPVGYEEDPLVNNTTAGSVDLRLRESSSGVDGGEDLGGSYDYGIAPTATWPDPTIVSQGDYGAGWEIGAYVYIPYNGAPLMVRNFRIIKWQ